MKRVILPATPVDLPHLGSAAGNSDHRQRSPSWSVPLQAIPPACMSQWDTDALVRTFQKTRNPRSLAWGRERCGSGSILGCSQTNLERKQTVQQSVQQHVQQSVQQQLQHSKQVSTTAGTALNTRVSTTASTILKKKGSKRVLNT
jgi:hypothetical protein